MKILLILLVLLATNCFILKGTHLLKENNQNKGCGCGGSKNL